VNTGKGLFYDEALVTGAGWHYPDLCGILLTESSQQHPLVQLLQASPATVANCQITYHSVCKKLHYRYVTR
jgi:hypothetical protein